MTGNTSCCEGRSSIGLQLGNNLTGRTIATDPTVILIKSNVVPEPELREYVVLLRREIGFWGPMEQTMTDVRKGASVARHSAIDG